MACRNSKMKSEITSGSTLFSDWSCFTLRDTDTTSAEYLFAIHAGDWRRLDWMSYLKRNAFSRNTDHTCLSSIKIVRNDVEVMEMWICAEACSLEKFVPFYLSRTRNWQFWSSWVASFDSCQFMATNVHQCGIPLLHDRDMSRIRNKVDEAVSSSLHNYLLTSRRLCSLTCNARFARFFQLLSAEQKLGHRVGLHPYWSSSDWSQLGQLEK